jgi:hypothetical protein
VKTTKYGSGYKIKYSKKDCRQQSKVLKAMGMDAELISHEEINTNDYKQQISWYSSKSTFTIKA